MATHDERDKVEAGLREANAAQRETLVRLERENERLRTLLLSIVLLAQEGRADTAGALTRPYGGTV